MNRLRRFALAMIAAASLAAPARGDGPWENRSAQEAAWRRTGVILIPHHPSYFFPLTYNTSPHPSSLHDEEHKEAKFQFSFKVLISDALFRRPNVHLYFGYTQISLWQVYNRDRSAPFRDINYSPEVFVSMDVERYVGPLRLREMDFGVVHESNGVTYPDSRNWNRVYGRFLFDYDNLFFMIKPWIRILESVEADENPDIYEFMGYGEVTAAWFMKNHVFSVMVRNNLRMERNRGAIRLDYSFPLTDNLTGLAQWFSGYGETLLDYDRPNNRFSIGIALSDWRRAL